LGFAAAVLALFFPLAANAERFSVKCPSRGHYHVTFDTDAGRVVYESPAGSALRGRIDKTLGNEIHFRLQKSGEEDFEGILGSDRERITWLGIPGDKSRQGGTDECKKTELRRILEKYDLIFPY